jgi:sigma-B regulation protein RsbU (phosphoserine phosphatase)
MVYGIYNIRTRNLVLASAGHNPTIVWRAGTRRHELCRPNGIALGFDPGPVFERTIQEARVPLSPGDRLVFYSDGVVECMNEQREEWGEERFCKFTEANAERSSQEFVRLLNQALEQHQGAAEQHDDITVVTFRIVS